MLTLKALPNYGIKSELDEKGAPPNHFRISYSQVMGNKHIKIGRHKRYDIKKGLTLEPKKSIALSIFLDVSIEFETMQGNWLFRKLINSSFSAEDLVSNLIGFYRAIDSETNFMHLCEPVNKSTALEIWDKYGPVGSIKNYTTIPLIFPINDNSTAPAYGSLPHKLRSIQPAVKGKLYREVN